jgi:hypothetical protein
MGWLSYSYWGMWAQFNLMWILYFIILLMILGGVWARSIHGTPEAYVGFTWIWAHTFKDPELAPHYDSERAMRMRMWCYENIDGGWVQCRNGNWFAFRKKSDAMAFKLTWLGG